MYLIQLKEVGNLKANANPSNPVGKRVHFVSTFCRSRDRSCDHRKLPSCFGRTKITQCTTRMEDYFLKPRWKWNNGYSIVPVFLYNRLKKYYFDYSAWICYYYGWGSAAIIWSREIWSEWRLLFETIYKQRVWLFQPFNLYFLSTVFQLK